jgi:hypothetical protein
MTHPRSSAVLRVLEWIPEIVLIAVTTFAGVWAQGRWFDPVGDTGTWWSVIYRLSNGGVLYRDVHLQFGPLSPYLLSLGGTILGTTSTYLLFASWFAAVAAGVLLVRLSRHFLTTFERLALVGLVIAASLFAPGPGRLVLAYAPAAVHSLILSLAALLLFYRPGRDTTRMTVLAGVLAGLAFCGKQEIGVAAAAALGVPVVTRSDRAWSRVLLAALGFLVVGGAAATLLFTTIPLADLRTSHLWPLVPRPPAEWDYLYRIVAGVTAEDWFREYLKALQVLLYYLSLVAFLGLLIARDWKLGRWTAPALLLGLSFVGHDPISILGEWFHPIALSVLVAFACSLLAIRNHGERDYLIALGIFAGLAGIRTAFSSNLGAHYSAVGHFGTSLTWVLFLCVLFPPLIPGGGKAAVIARRGAAILVFAISWYGVLISSRSLRSPAKERVDTPQGAIWVDHKSVPLFEAIREKIRPGERVLVVPEVNGVDAAFELRSASPFVSHVPGWLNPKQEEALVKALEGDPPDAVVVFSRVFEEFGKEGPFGVGYDLALARWVERNYTVVFRTAVGTVHRKKPPPTAGRFPPTAGRLLTITNTP